MNKSCFIKLHNVDNDEVFWINTDTIDMIEWSEEDNGSLVSCVNNALMVKETPEHIMQLIKEA